MFILYIIIQDQDIVADRVLSYSCPSSAGVGALILSAKNINSYSGERYIKKICK